MEKERVLTQKLNVIIILIDGCRLDRIINSSYLQNLKSHFSFFSNSIAYSPHTIAAMHAVFSGCYGTRTGTNSYWSTYQFKKNRFKTLTEYLNDLDYYTYADLHSEIVIPKQGFDKFVTYDEDKVDIVSRHSDLLEDFSKDNNSFVYLHYSKIHTGISNEVLKVFNNFSKEYFENNNLNLDRYSKLFHNAEIYLDSIMNKIIELKLLKNSIILVLSDHGISVGEKVGERAYGAFCYDYTLKTFGYLYNSDISPTTIHSQVRHVDYMPTILEMLKIPINTSFEKLDGQSLIPVINGQNQPENFAFSETGNPLNENAPPKIPNTKSIRNSNWKLIHNEYDDTKELYDLENDPKEEKNIIGKNPEIEIKLIKELFKHTKN